MQHETKLFLQKTSTRFFTTTQFRTVNFTWNRAGNSYSISHQRPHVIRPPRACPVLGTKQNNFPCESPSLLWSNKFPQNVALLFSVHLLVPSEKSIKVSSNTARPFAIDFPASISWHFFSPQVWSSVGKCTSIRLILHDVLCSTAWFLSARKF